MARLTYEEVKAMLAAKRGEQEEPAAEPEPAATQPPAEAPPAAEPEFVLSPAPGAHAAAESEPEPPPEPEPAPEPEPPATPEPAAAATSAPLPAPPPSPAAPSPPPVQEEQLPAAPRTIAETGLSESFLQNLMLKLVHRHGELTTGQLQRELCLPWSGIVEAIYDDLRAEHLLEVRGAESRATSDLRVGLSRAGTDRAEGIMLREGYVGPAPVSLADYTRAIVTQPVNWSSVTSDMIRNALGDVVVGNDTLCKLGPAFNSGRSMFLFGNPGNGKTLISERMASALQGNMVVPYAIEVGGYVMQYFDEHYHQRAKRSPQQTEADVHRDQRWLVVQRPFVMVGGELQLEDLNLVFDDNTKFYTAPVHLKANGGVLLIDDFGRQQVGPRDLLNRWIVPLEKRRDYYTLRTGLQVEMPFEVLVIFSTNLEPRDLVDEAFLRRIRYKIEIGDPSEQDFRTIFKNCCTQLNVLFDQEMLDYLIDRHYVQSNRQFRSVHPRDLLLQLIDIANYTGQEVRLTPDLIDQAVATYFVEL